MVTKLPRVVRNYLKSDHCRPASDHCGLSLDHCGTCRDHCGFGTGHCTEMAALPKHMSDNVHLEVVINNDQMSC